MKKPPPPVKPPPPIRPLSASGPGTIVARKPAPARRRPKWPKWLLMPTVRLWEAVALSLGIEPPEHLVDIASGGRRGAAFKDRLQIACANLKALGCTGALPESRSVAEVQLRQFARWCLSIGWQIPDELRQLADDMTPQPSPPTAATLVTRSSSKPPRRPSSLDTKEVDSLLHIVKLLAKKAKVNWENPGQGAKQMEQIAAELGEESLAKNTLVKFFRMIKELMPPPVN